MDMEQSNTMTQGNEKEQESTQMHDEQNVLKGSIFKTEQPFKNGALTQTFKQEAQLVSPMEELTLNPISTPFNTATAPNGSYQPHFQATSMFQPNGLLSPDQRFMVQLQQHQKSSPLQMQSQHMYNSSLRNVTSSGLSMLQPHGSSKLSTDLYAFPTETDPEKSLLNFGVGASRSDMSESTVNELVKMLQSSSDMNNFMRTSPAERKRKHETTSSLDEKKARTFSDHAGPSTNARVLLKPVLECSLDEVVTAIRWLKRTTQIFPTQVQFKPISDVVQDREVRIDRFHKKKSTDILKLPYKQLKKATSYASGVANSSGQGCTIVVVSRKCIRHARGKCNLNEPHEPGDIVETKEPVTRSNFGKWINAHLKSLKS